MQQHHETQFAPSADDALATEFRRERSGNLLRQYSAGDKADRVRDFFRVVDCNERQCRTVFALVAGYAQNLSRQYVSRRQNAASFSALLRPFRVQFARDRARGV